MHGANADLIRLHDAGDKPVKPRHLTDALASRQPLLGSLDLGGGDWRPTKPNGCCTSGSLSTENSVTARLAEVERHHFRKVEDGQTVAGCCVETLLVQIQCNAGSSAHLDEADEFGERAPHTVDTVEHYPYRPNLSGLLRSMPSGRVAGRVPYSLSWV